MEISTPFIMLQQKHIVQIIQRQFLKSLIQQNSEYILPPQPYFVNIESGK